MRDDERMTERNETGSYVAVGRALPDGTVEMTLWNMPTDDDMVAEVTAILGLPDQVTLLTPDNLAGAQQGIGSYATMVRD